MSNLLKRIWDFISKSREKEVKKIKKDVEEIKSTTVVSKTTLNKNKSKLDNYLKNIKR